VTRARFLGGRAGARRDPGGRPASVFAWRRLKHDPLEVDQRRSPEPQCRLKPFEAELAGIEGPPELVQGRPLVIEYLVARSLQQDQVPRTPEAVRETDVALALAGIKAFQRQDDRLPCLQPFQDGGGEQLLHAVFDLVRVDAIGQQRPYPHGRERRAALLDDSVGELHRL
jgi:hypothetical protein